MRRSVHAETGAVTLSFFFPEVAQERYGEQLAEAEDELGVPVTIARQAHQAALAEAAEHCLPTRVKPTGRPSIFVERRSLRLEGLGEASPEEIAQAQAEFFQQTRWHLDLIVRQSAPPSPAAEARGVPKSQPPLPGTASVLTVSSASRGWPLPQQEALEMARALLSALPGFQKVGIDQQLQTLLVRFDFPDVSQERDKEVFSRLEAETGSRVRVHPTARQEALIEQTRRLLPAGLQSSATPSIYWGERAVGLLCTGTADAHAIEQAERLFREETGWCLSLLLAEHVAGRLSQAEAMAQASQRLQVTQGLYQIGVDAKRGILWLHYHFPAITQERYGEAFAQLAEATGWRVELHPRVHQKALVDQACLLLPAQHGLSGKPSIHEEAQRLVLTVAGPLSEEIAQDIRQRFSEETGWTLEIQCSQAQPRELQSSAPEYATRLGEAEATALVRTTLGEPSLRLLVDAVRGILIISEAGPAVRQRYVEQREALQERTGWQIELVQETNDERMHTEVRLALEGTGLHVANILLLPEEQRAVAHVQGTCKLPALVAAQEAFNEQTGWLLTLEHA
ncbi:MAG TPA: hypothetical protein VIZ18_03740 [Ktedonobacteraceae bacterium]